MYLIDFDAAAMSNPTVSFAEAAFALSKQGKDFNQDFYKAFISSYLKKYGEVDVEFETALDVSMNGKLQWLEYIMSKCSKKNEDYNKDTISMLNELKLFIYNKENMLNYFNDYIKESAEKKNKKKKKSKKKKKDITKSYTDIIDS